MTAVGAPPRNLSIHRGASSLLGLALLLIVLFLPMLSTVPQIEWPLWEHRTKLLILTLAAAVVVGVPALAGIALVQARVREREAEPIDDAAIPSALEARAAMLRFLFVAGTVIGLAVLAFGAVRRAVVPTFASPEALPQELVLIYGALFTGLLVLVYAPAHADLRRLGFKIRDHHFPIERMPDPDADTFKSWLERRAALEGLLQLNVSPAQQLQASMFIIAPLLSAVITTVVPTPR